MNLRNLRWTDHTPGASLDFLLPTGVTDPLLLRVARDNELSPRENAIFLLQTAAEIEHSLLVQYLFAAYSLEVGQSGPPHFRGNPPATADALKLTAGWRSELLKIAKEEMGHLITVQNVLRLLGGPLHFDRETFPYKSDFYPFRFTLRKANRTSLAMYVCAEMPADPPAAILPAAERDSLVKRAMSSEGSSGVMINHVGALYRAIIALLQALDPAQDFRADTLPWMAGLEWGAPGARFIIPSVKNRDDAVQALQAVSEQGEGLSGTHVPDGASHFERLLAIYRKLPESEEDKGPLEWDPARPIARNPNTTAKPHDPKALDPGAALEEKENASGRISNPQTRLWAQLFNVRYRMLLVTLAHALEKKKVAGSTRDALHDRAIGLMFDLTKLADRLTAMRLEPEAAPGDLNAGPPFEMPYTTGLPGRESDRWRLHANLTEASRLITEAIGGGAQDPTLQDLRDEDTDDQWTATLQAEIAKSRPCEDEV